MFGTFLQIIVAVAVVVIMFVIGFAIYNMEKIRAIRDTGVLRKEVPVFSGIKDLKNSDSYDTINPLSSTYKDLTPSINQRGGAEYTYSFWLYISDQNSLSNYAPLSNTNTPDNGFDQQNPFVLLLRGEPKLTPYKGPCYKAQDQLRKDILVKNPLIRLDNRGQFLMFELNTYKTPDGVKANTQSTSCESASTYEGSINYKFGIKELPYNEWFLVTFVVQDVSPPLQNKVFVQIYINSDSKIKTYMDGSIDVAQLTSNMSLTRNLKSRLHIAPTIEGMSITQPRIAEMKVMMGDLSYFNYALDSAAVKARFDRGKPTYFASSTPAQTNVSNVATAGVSEKITIPV